MKKAEFIVATVLSLLLVACATGPQLQSREDWISATNRTYRDIAKDDILKAAEYLFRLSDGNDFTIAHDRDGLIATRQWMVYLIIAAGFGTDHWSVRAQEMRDGSVQVTVNASTQSQAAGITQPTISGGTPSMSPTFGAPVQSPALYKLFWARMDYLLGIRHDWLTCADASTIFDVSRAAGGMELLCNPLNVNDERPSGPLVRPTLQSNPSAPTPSPQPYTDRMNIRVEPPPSKPTPTGQFTYNAERLARTEKCSESPIATLIAKGPGFENYTVVCSTGDALAIRCDFGKCRVLR